MTALPFHVSRSFLLVKGSFCGMTKFDRQCDLRQPCMERLGKNIYMNALTHPVHEFFEAGFLPAVPVGDMPLGSPLPLSWHWNVPLEVSFPALSSTLEGRHGRLLGYIPSCAAGKTQTVSNKCRDLYLRHSAEKKIRKNELIQS